MEIKSLVLYGSSSKVCAMTAKFSEPIFRYIRTITKIKNTEAIIPVMRYFKPASSADGVLLYALSI